jgi:hypothetical protein
MARAPRYDRGMRLLALLLAIVVAICLFLLGRMHPRPVEVATVVAPRSAAPAAPVVADDVEPDEATLRRIEFDRYAQIERLGGMPLVVTQTGQRITLHPKLYDVRKEECHRLPQATGEWECGVTITLSLRPGDSPGSQGERVFVRRGPAGDWVGK